MRIQIVIFIIQFFIMGFLISYLMFSPALDYTLLLVASIILIILSVAMIISTPRVPTFDDIERDGLPKKF